MISEPYITGLINEHLQGTDRFVVDLYIKPGNRIHVFIDSDTSVAISHCVELSRHIESNLDREAEDFELNVSSAGIDHPYKLLRQYVKNVGREVAVTLKDGRKITGKLLAAEEEGINVLETKKVKKEITETNHRIAFSQIKETKEIIKF